MLKSVIPSTAITQQASLKCSFGQYLCEDCHVNSYTADKVLYKMENLTGEIVRILILRTPNISKKLDNIQGKTICGHHYAKILSYYSNNQRRCCDPWNKHSTFVKLHLTEISLELAEKSKSVCKLDLIPGKKMCKNCSDVLRKKILSFNQEIICCIDPFRKHRRKVFSQLNILKTVYIEYLDQAYNIKLNKENKICSVCEKRLETEYFKSKEVRQLNVNSMSRQYNSQHSTDDSSVHTNFENASPISDYEAISQKRRCFDEILGHFSIPPFKRHKLSNDKLVLKGVEIVQNIASQISNSFEEAHSVKLLIQDLRQMSIQNYGLQT